MTWRNWGWYGWYRWFRLGMTAFMAAMIVVLVSDNETPAMVQAIITVVLISLLVLLLIGHPWITITPGKVQIGYFPLYRSTLPMAEIRDVREVRVRPLREYGGVGVRGLAKSTRGLLLGGYPASGIRFETVANRRYTITMENLEPIVQELARYGCTLSAGNDDVFAEDAAR